MQENNLWTISVLNLHLNPPNKRICLSTAEELRLVFLSEIVRCESKRNYSTVFLQDGSKIVVAKTLGDFEEELREYGFMRVHNSALINLAFVKSFRKKDGGAIVMLDDTEIAVATRKKDEVIRRLKCL